MYLLRNFKDRQNLYVSFFKSSGANSSIWTNFQDKDFSNHSYSKFLPKFQWGTLLSCCALLHYYYSCQKSSRIIVSHQELLLTPVLLTPVVQKGWPAGNQAPWTANIPELPVWPVVGFLAGEFSFSPVGCLPQAVGCLPAVWPAWLRSWPACPAPQAGSLLGRLAARLTNLLTGSMVFLKLYFFLTVAIVYFQAKY